MSEPEATATGMDTEPIEIEVTGHADASEQDDLLEASDNSGEAGDCAPQGKRDVQTTAEELDDDDGE